ncbi:DUF3221 domain-containing protein [Bacillus thuringiensis]|uniref:DUF3221 domain-containing protein n=1 Tax=Bacillus thuringiensis TaxID=1428 RepID=A0A9X6Y7Y2_BACTU|nr:DUF3221 domain-containing protein [Bacillus thuringiensis]PEA86657.1 DUF3221 domain-containing protein [Bacillus thuringiensis]
MFTTKQKLVIVAITLTLGCGFTFGLTPASAASNESSANRVSIDNNYMTVIDTPTLEEGLLYQENWQDLVNKAKVLIVPVPEDTAYTVKDKLYVKYTIVTMSLPPIALSPIIEKVTE